MTDKKKYPYWLAVEESKTVCFADLPHMMAKAMHPNDSDVMDYAAARINLENELPQAVRDDLLRVRNPAGLGLHTSPHGNALQRAVMLPDTDLEPFLNERGIELRLTPHGSGPEYWTLENAAAAMQEQLNWHDGTRAEFQDQLQAAAQAGGLVIREPRTCLPIDSPNARTYWELVTPADVNEWLEKLGAPYRWSVTQLAEVELEPVPVVEVPDPIRYGLLATRAELCTAFGVWGLSMPMFRNLTERNWLMDARKVKGKGQRGNIVEPLFCPFEVMRGLATKTKKPKLSEEKGWDVLENRFKTVFEENQQFDPRERTG